MLHHNGCANPQSRVSKTTEINDNVRKKVLIQVKNICTIVCVSTFNECRSYVSNNQRVLKQAWDQALFIFNKKLFETILIRDFFFSMSHLLERAC